MVCIVILHDVVSFVIISSTIMTRKAMKREDKLRIGITDNMVLATVYLSLNMSSTL